MSRAGTLTASLGSLFQGLIPTSELSFFKERDSHHRVKASSECQCLCKSWERDQEGARESCALPQWVTAGRGEQGAAAAQGVEGLLCNLDF